MSLEDLANIGEFVGALGVIISLVYLTTQIRQNTRALKSSAHQETTREAGSFSPRDGALAGWRFPSGTTARVSRRRSGKPSGLQR